MGNSARKQKKIKQDIVEDIIEEKEDNNNNKKNKIILFIGDKGSGKTEFIDQYELIACCNTSISKVYAGKEYTIYSDDELENIWCAGCNTFGQCAINIEQSTDSKHIEEYRLITYFKQNNIKIRKICVSSTGSNTFFISDDNELYGCGKNLSNQLGISDIDDLNVISCQYKAQYEPIFIKELQNVIDVQCSPYFSVALCSSNNELIIQNWCRLYLKWISNDIISAIMIFCKKCIVYSTSYSGHGHGNKYKDNHQYGWSEIDIFKDCDIIKISVGKVHSLFLDSNGSVWSCGYNTYGQIGVANNNNITHYNIPVQIEYFIENGIKIVDIACGCIHCLALDENGRVYCWGDNKKKQCATDRSLTVNTPYMIKSLENHEIDVIKCGYHTSYCKTKSGKHFMWGCNQYSQCLQIFNYQSYIAKPYCINGIVEMSQRFNGKSIVELHPGFTSTTIVCQ